MRAHVLPLALLVTALLTAASCSKKSDADAGGTAEYPDASAPPPFEGQVEGVIRHGPDPAAPSESMSIFVKSGRVRFDIPESVSRDVSPFGGKGYGIVDSGAKKLSVVSDARKQVLVVALNGGGGLPPFLPGAGGGAGSTPTRVARTGKTDKVAGFNCEYWDIVSDHKLGTMCMSDDGPSWLTIPLTGVPRERAWELELVDGKHFPLSITGYASDGLTRQGSFEVVRIDRKPLTDAQFEVPADYKTIDLDKMMQGARGMPATPGGGTSPSPLSSTHP